MAPYKVKSKINVPNIVMMKVDELISYTGNAKLHPLRQVKKIAMSIEQYGFNVPVLIDGKNEIIAGHGRLLAAKELKMDMIPCVHVDHLTPEQVRAFRIADNKVAESDWDMEKLDEEMKLLFGDGYDLALTGFEEAEFTRVIEEVSAGLAINEERQRKPILPPEALAPSPKDTERLSTRKILVEFSGGKDSSAAALWCKLFWPQARVELVYCDLGADFYGYHEWIHDIAKALGLPVMVLRSERNLFDVFVEKGKWPFWTGSYCQALLHETVDRYFRTHQSDTMIVVRGGRAKEKARAAKKQVSRWRELPGLKGYDCIQPLYFSDKGVGEAILTSHGLPIWPGYARGFLRTACRVCPGQKPQAYAAIRMKEPGIWEEILWLEKRLGPGAWHRSWTKDGHLPSFEEAADEGELRLLAGTDAISDGSDGDAMCGEESSGDAVTDAARRRVRE